ncbi:DNA alkylation repair protein [Streptomyces sp. NPDC003717]|uniref:DNA alkylation repair protein n=1 Tax=Streptomyces sp. NPDC003717 TaxID=3154276 RepID=UPI0033AE3B0A
MPEPSVTDLAGQLRDRLEHAAVPGRAAAEKRYLKSDLDHVGVPLPAMRALVRSFVRGHRELDHGRATALAAELWSRPVHEHRSTALLVLAGYTDRLGADDVALFEALLRQCRSWGHVDLLAPFVVGRLLPRHPGLEEAVRRWAADPGQWVRRGGVLSFLMVLREEDDFPRWFPVFAEVAEPLLTDERFFVRKAVGWALREGTKHHPDRVADWLAERLPRLSGLTLREASRRLPEPRRAHLAAAHADLHRRGRGRAG